ncbi:hypothetical protein Hanom_Chr17g01570541 [Helianthus anomalus]
MLLYYFLMELLEYIVIDLLDTINNENKLDDHVYFSRRSLRNLRWKGLRYHQDPLK